MSTPNDTSNKDAAGDTPGLAANNNANHEPLNVPEPPADLHDLLDEKHHAHKPEKAAHHRPPGERILTLALAGNPNAGKTTAFNRYTGSHQHVANYPGITVERKVGALNFNGHKIRMIDLPGTYSLTAYAQDELVARRGLSEDNIDCVIDVINAGAIERNLYLAVQIMEMGIPMVLALNMYDEARAQGMNIDHQKLSELMGVPVVPTVARTGEGLPEALAHAVDIALERYDDLAGDTATGSESKKDHPPLVISYGNDLDPVIEELTALIEEKKLFTHLYPARWVAIKYLENDSEIRDKGRLANPALSDKIEMKVAELARHLEQTLHTYPEAVIADYRYGYINGILRQGVITRRDELSVRLDKSDRIDKVLTHRFLGPLIMVGIIYFMYTVTIQLGDIPLVWVENFFGWLHEVVADNMSDGLLKSLIVSGIIDGVGGVLSFVPLIFLMFLQISFLEDSGYMARVAYMLDRVFRAFGLHGYSVMPFVISGGIAGGCAVPGIMAARTLRSPKEKLATLLTAPFMTCGAKLPVFLLLAVTFFPEQETAVLMSIWLLAWASALLVSRLLRSTLLKGESTPFVMELPPYRIPTLFGVLLHSWERIWQYIKKAGTVILAISVIVWAAMTFPGMPEEMTAPYEERIATAEEALKNAGGEDEELATLLAQAEAELSSAGLAYSAAGRVGRALETITTPAGFDWRTNIALVGGFGAKEVIVSTLGTAYSLGEIDPEDAGSLQERIAADPHWNKANAAALMVFVLLYAPCFVAVVVIGQESGSWKWSVFSLVFNTLFAFVAAVAVYQVGLLLI